MDSRGEIIIMVYVKKDVQIDVKARLAQMFYSVKCKSASVEKGF